jgi:hypothetical protein
MRIVVQLRNNPTADQTRRSPPRQDMQIPEEII